jgi:hypothetical protein
MRGRAVKVVVILFDVLAVVAFAVGEAEESFLEDRIVAIPEREAEAEALLVVGIAGDAVFTPAIGARTSLIVREIVPGGAIVAVVFADGAPLAFAEVRTPTFPRDVLESAVIEADAFGIRDWGWHGSLKFWAETEPLL